MESDTGEESLDLKALEIQIRKNENFRFMDAFSHYEAQEVLKGVKKEARIENLGLTFKKHHLANRFTQKLLRKVRQKKAIQSSSEFDSDYLSRGFSGSGYQTDNIPGFTHNLDINSSEIKKSSADSLFRRLMKKRPTTEPTDITPEEPRSELDRDSVTRRPEESGGQSSQKLDDLDSERRDLFSKEIQQENKQTILSLPKLSFEDSQITETIENAYQYYRDYHDEDKPSLSNSELLISLAEALAQADAKRDDNFRH